MSPGIPTRLLATQSDERLLALVRQGHERAFEAIVQRYRKPLLGYCRRLRLEDARAEDIVQLALLKTWIAVREGSEVRELKAWLYRVVHNTAVNAMRDSAHDGEPLADPMLGSTSHPHTDDSQFDRRLAMREALAEVAALPPLQREVIVRTAVGGDSHEQVASDLGITNGAVRGLLYRARTTLRTGITALTPPPLLGWLVGRSDQGGPAPERLAELAGGGGAVGVGGVAGVSGLLLKGGAVALTVGTVITGATVVHLSASTPHRRHRLIASAAPPSGAGAGSTAEAHAAASYGDISATAAGAHRDASGRRAGRGVGSAGRKTRGMLNVAGGGSITVSGGDHAPRSTTRVTGDAHKNAPAKAPPGQSPAPGSTQGSSQTGGGSGAGSGQSGGSGESGSGSGGPVGPAAGNGTQGGSDTSGSSESTSGSSSEGGTSSGDQSGSGSGESGSGSGSGSESGTGSSEGSGSGGSSGGSSGSSGSESSGGEQSGSLVGTVVHEVGSILEHLLH